MIFWIILSIVLYLVGALHMAMNLFDYNLKIVSRRSIVVAVLAITLWPIVILAALVFGLI